MIHIHIPSVPISVNKAYAKRRGSGARVLTKAGKKYKNETKTFIAREYANILTFFKPNKPYVLLVEFTFQGRDKLYCKGWPDGDAQNRYKKLDVTNRTKLLEDALSNATGIDDSQNWSVTVVKTWARDYEATNIWVWSRDEERNNPLDELVRHLKATQPQPHRAVSAVP